MVLAIKTSVRVALYRARLLIKVHIATKLWRVEHFGWSALRWVSYARYHLSTVGLHAAHLKRWTDGGNCLRELNDNVLLDDTVVAIVILRENFRHDRLHTDIFANGLGWFLWFSTSWAALLIQAAAGAVLPWHFFLRLNVWYLWRNYLFLSIP